MTTSITNVQQKSFKSNDFLKLTQIDGVKFADSRMVATELGMTHKNLIQVVKNYRAIIEAKTVPFSEITTTEHFYLFTIEHIFGIYGFLPKNSITMEFKTKVINLFNNVQ